VRGCYEPGGDFLVSHVCYPDVAPQPPRPPLYEDSYVALVSGLHMGGVLGDPLRLQLLLDFLGGGLGSGGDQSFSAKVGRAGRRRRRGARPAGAVGHTAAAASRPGRARAAPAPGRRPTRACRHALSATWTPVPARP
jgi:hypothetical protein